MRHYVGIPFQRYGRTRAGLDCAGLAMLYLNEQFGLGLECPASTSAEECEGLLEPFTAFTLLGRGDVVFFRQLNGTCRITHVAICVSEGATWPKLLNILDGCESRIENGFTLLRRLGLEPAGFIRVTDAERLCRALADPKLATVGQIILFVVGIALSAAAAALAPKLGRFGARHGRYSDSGLVTQVSPELPLADPLGKIFTAGNSIYQQLGARGETVSDITVQRACKIIVLGSGPFEEIDYQTGLKINGTGWNDKYWKNGTNIDGFDINPAQTEGEAMDGSIMGDSNVPSISLYTGAHDITVPVDVRAQFDRDFPIYGLSGCGYLAFRMINGNKFATFNVSCRVKGRKCRTFNSSGFVKTTATSESLTGADGTKVRFKLAFDDIASVSSLTVGATSYSEISSSVQTGNVYQLNRLKGFVEFITAPSNGASVTITYQYYARAWTENPASHVVYLLTEAVRGKGFPESKIDWAAAVAFRDHCDADVTWNGSVGVLTEDRYKAGYNIDSRKPVQEHLRALLDASNGLLFVSDGKFVLKVRKSESSVFSFTEGEIIAETFASELVDRSDRPNRLKMLHASEDSLNSETEVVLDDVVDQAARAPRAGNNGVVEENLKLPAVTSSSQAERLGLQWLREFVASRWQVDFATNVKGLALQPGDVVDVTHSSQPAWAAKLFRVDELTHDEDDRLVIRASEFVDAYF